MGLSLLKDRHPCSSDQLRHQLQTLLAAGDEDQFSRLLLGLHVDGRRIYELCDALLAPIFAEVGEQWCRGELEVYQERRGVEICTRLLHRLRAILPPIRKSAPLALGSTLEGDPYTIANTMAEIALREAGWNAMSCGTGNPASTLCIAIEHARPELFWLSVSSFVNEESLQTSITEIARTARSTGTFLAVGGRMVPEAIRAQTPHLSYCKDLASLVALSATVL
jgi:methanogenic corrinoid protein MtbC1